MPSTNVADQLLELLRDRVRWFTASIYLIYFLFWWAGSGPGKADLLRDPHTWVAFLALLALSTAALPVTSLFRSRAMQRVLMLALLGAVLSLAQQNLSLGRSQAELMVWLNVIMIGVSISFGAVTGLTLAGAMLALLLSSNSPGILSESILLAGLCSAVLSAALGYLIMKFIEQNLSLHEQATDQLAAARKDALTGVLGRAALEEEMHRTTQHARKTGTPLSLVVADIDHFKRVNDQFGHGAGDDVLRSFAKRLRRNVGGSGGMVGRWGGEEFVVILPGVARPDALAMAERLRQEVSGEAVAGQQITASFGVASFRSSGDDVDSLFGRADERLYEAKNAGRNAVRG